MSSGTDKQTSWDVANQAEDARADLANTLQQLRENLKPENVVEEVVGNARVGVNTLADGLYALARNNPIPSLLIGAGCAMVMGFGSKTLLPRKPLIDIEPLGTPSSGRGTRLSVFSAGDGKVWRDSNTTPLDPVSKPEQNVMSTSPYSQGAGVKPQSRLTGLFHEQPLILAALGVAVGAAIGAALPITGVEDEWMGGVSSSVRQAAQKAAQREIDELKAVANRTAEQMWQSATEHGLSPDNLHDLAKDVGEQATSAIREVGTVSDRGV